jgi:hypothetical protein
VLGERGLAAYRRLAEREWKKVPVLGPGRDDPAKYGKRFRITHIMETLARESRDLEVLVAIKSRDLSLPYGYLQIAEAYNEACREVIGLLRKVRGLMIRLGRESEVALYVESVRAAHKPKRNFIKLLDGARWS